MFQHVAWGYQDPSNASFISATHSGAPIYLGEDGQAELDPLGSNVGMSNPYDQNNPPNLAALPGGGWGGWGDPSGSYSCMVDWVSQPCSFAAQVLSSGAGVIGPLSQIAAHRSVDGGRNWSLVLWESGPDGPGYWSTKKSYGDGAWDGGYVKVWKAFDSSNSGGYSLAGFQARRQSDDYTSIPLPGNFTDLIKQRLNKSDCNAFISTLISKVVENYNRHLAERNEKEGTNFPRYVAQAVDGFDLLKKISSQEGFVLKDNLMSGNIPAGGTVSGSIQTKDAQVMIATRYRRTDTKYDPTQMWINEYVSTAIHEMIHLTGRGVFLDQDLARATYDLGENKKPVESKFNPDKILNYSSDWDNILENHCGENIK